MQLLTNILCLQLILITTMHIFNGRSFMDHLKSIKTFNSTIGFVYYGRITSRALVIDARITVENVIPWLVFL
jgi:hypothetical protein